MPKRLMAAVKRPIQVKKQRERRKASSFPCCSIRCAKIGIKLAEMAAAKIASKNVLGIRLAVKKAALSIPVPKLWPRSMSRTSPITLPSMVMTIMRPTVFM